MTRYCSMIGTRVIGGAGKMLKYFEKNWQPKSIISYADRRWSDGGMYKTLGFEYSHNSAPDYWYFTPSSFVLESRVAYQKHILSKKLKVFDESKTEKQNMLDNGYMVIYDCGNKVYFKKRT